MKVGLASDSFLSQMKAPEQAGFYNDNSFN